MSTDKMILTNIISKIPIFQNNFPSTKSDIHPLDDEILSDLKQINSLLVDDDNEFELFKQVDTIKGLWKKLIEKSIISLRYFDTREPFLKNDKKKPHAYGLSQLCEYFNNYTDFESMLYGGSKYYRDHVVHVFRVWLLGIQLMLDNNYIDKIVIDKQICINSQEKVAIWTLISLCHDLGYPLEKALQVLDKTKAMMKSFIVNPTITMDLAFSGVQNSMNDFVLRLISSKMTCGDEVEGTVEHKDDTSKNYVARLQPKYYFKLQKSLEHNKHGILSSLIIYKMLTYFLESDYNVNEDYSFNKEEARQFYIRREVLRAIASHTCSDIYQLDSLNFSFLLILTDDAQEWGRKNISELYTLHKSNKYSFEKVEISPLDNDKYVCRIIESYELQDIDLLPSLITRFVNQGKNYRDLFRDGQDTENRNFNFERLSKIKVAINGGMETYHYKLIIPHDECASSFIEKEQGLIDKGDSFYKKLESKKVLDIILRNNKISINME